MKEKGFIWHLSDHWYNYYDVLFTQKGKGTNNDMQNTQRYKRIGKGAYSHLLPSSIQILNMLHFLKWRTFDDSEFAQPHQTHIYILKKKLPSKRRPLLEQYFSSSRQNIIGSCYIHEDDSMENSSSMLVTWWHWKRNNKTYNHAGHLFASSKENCCACNMDILTGCPRGWHNIESMIWTRMKRMELRFVISKRFETNLLTVVFRQGIQRKRSEIEDYIVETNRGGKRQNAKAITPERR